MWAKDGRMSYRERGKTGENELGREIKRAYIGV